jgi:hypothetical protein
MLDVVPQFPRDAPKYCEKCGKPLGVVTMTQRYNRYTGEPVAYDVAVCEALMTNLGNSRRVN